MAFRNHSNLPFSCHLSHIWTKHYNLSTSVSEKNLLILCCRLEKYLPRLNKGKISRKVSKKQWRYLPYAQGLQVWVRSLIVFFIHKGALKTTEIKKQRNTPVEFLCRINFSGSAQKLNRKNTWNNTFWFCIFTLYFFKSFCLESDKQFWTRRPNKITSVTLQLKSIPDHDRQISF